MRRSVDESARHLLQGLPKLCRWHNDLALTAPRRQTAALCVSPLVKPCSASSSVDLKATSSHTRRVSWFLIRSPRFAHVREPMTARPSPLTLQVCLMFPESKIRRRLKLTRPDRPGLPGHEVINISWACETLIVAPPPTKPINDHVESLGTSPLSLADSDCHDVPRYCSPDFDTMSPPLARFRGTERGKTHVP